MATSWSFLERGEDDSPWCRRMVQPEYNLPHFSQATKVLLPLSSSTLFIHPFIRTYYSLHPPRSGEYPPFPSTLFIRCILFPPSLPPSIHPSITLTLTHSSSHPCCATKPLRRRHTPSESDSATADALSPERLTASHAVRVAVPLGGQSVVWLQRGGVNPLLPSLPTSHSYILFPPSPQVR